MAVRESILNLPEYHDFVREYAGNLEGFLFDICQLTLSKDQSRLSKLAVFPTAKVTVASGTGTGKTAWIGGAALWSMWCHPVAVYDGKTEIGSNTYIGAPVIQQVADGVWKEMNDNFQRVKTIKDLRFLTSRTHTKAERWYMDGYKDMWFIAKIALGTADSVAIAGKHRFYQTIFVDEAAGVKDEHYDVINGTQTQGGNRTFLFSQPAKTTGYFYETHHALSFVNTPVEEGGWINLRFSSVNAPHVSRQWIKAREIETGGVDSVEYRIRVLGLFSEADGKMLINRAQLDQALDRKDRLIPIDSTDWGWFLSVDVAAGEYRDYSVATLVKVSGYGEERLYEFVDMPIHDNRIDLHQLRAEIGEICAKYSNITVLVDAGGAGSQLAKDLEADGLNVEKVLWGKPSFKKDYKNRFLNQRAQSNVHMRDAIRQGRVRFSWNLTKKVHSLFVYQVTHIPYFFTDSGTLRYQIMSKKNMAAQGIKSPDIFDTMCFPAIEGMGYQISDKADGGVSEVAAKKSALDIVREKLKKKDVK